MKLVLVVIGSLGGLYAIVGSFLFIRTMMKNNPGTAYGGANIAASVVPVCLGLIDRLCGLLPKGVSQAKIIDGA